MENISVLVEYNKEDKLITISQENSSGEFIPVPDEAEDDEIIRLMSYLLQTYVSDNV